MPARYQHSLEQTTAATRVPRPRKRRADAARPEVPVVDDNVNAAESLRMSLELSGHRVKSVHGDTAALTALKESRPDLVLRDIGLPDIDGYEVARRVRTE